MSSRDRDAYLAKVVEVLTYLLTYLAKVVEVLTYLLTYLAKVVEVLEYGGFAQPDSVID